MVGLALGGRDIRIIAKRAPREHTVDAHAKKTELLKSRNQTGLEIKISAFSTISKKQEVRNYRRDAHLPF